MSNELIKYLFSTAVFGGLIIWAIKKLFSWQIQNEMERFKSEIKLREYKEQLKFSKLYEDNALFLKQFFIEVNRLKRLLEKFYELIKKDDPTTKSQFNSDVKPFIDKLFYVKELFEDNRIIISESLCKEIETVVDKVHSTAGQIVLGILLRSQDFYDDAGKAAGIEIKKISELNDEEKKNFEEKIKKIDQLVESDINDLLLQLEHEFRKVLTHYL